MTNKNNKVIYTCITGGYDLPVNHTHIDPSWDYVCFTDDIPKDEGSFVWEFRPLKFKKLDDVRNNRWHKIHPHLLFPEYEESLYVDANVKIVGKEIFNDIEKMRIKNQLISFGPHFERGNIFDEFEECKRLGKDELGIMEKQEKLIREAGFSGKFGVFFENNIIYRKHNSEKVKKIMQEWWWWIENYSRRDQLSLVYVLWKNNFKVIPLKEISYRGKNSGIEIVYNKGHITKEELFLIKESLEKAIQQKDQDISNLNQVVQQKDQDISNLNQVVQQKDQDISNLNRVVQQKDQDISNLNRVIHQKDQEILIIRSSKFWGIREFYLKLKNYERKK